MVKGRTILKADELGGKFVYSGLRYCSFRVLGSPQPETMATEGGGDEIEVVDIVRREEDEAFRGVLGEDKVGVPDQEQSFELSLLEASERRLAGPESDVEAEYDAGVSEPPEARSLTEVDNKEVYHDGY